MSEISEYQILRRNAFGLVDSAMVGHLPAGMSVEAMVPPGLTSSAHLMPNLIDLQNASDDQLRVLSECLRRAHEFGQPPPVAMLVMTSLSAKEFVRHWNSMQLASLPPKRKVWLRLHDPRVLHQLLRILTPTQRQKLFRRSEAFTYWVGEEWIIAAANGGNSLHTCSAEHGVALPYGGQTKWDWTRIEKIGIVNRALLGAGVRRAAALTSHGALAEQLIERAYARHGLVDHADMVEFAVRGLTTSNTFDEHPNVARVIKPGTDHGEESSLSDRLALIDEHTWDELRRPVKI
jgi:hypothetical protein